MEESVERTSDTSGEHSSTILDVQAEIFGSMDEGSGRERAAQSGCEETTDETKRQRGGGYRIHSHVLIDEE